MSTTQKTQEKLEALQKAVANDVIAAEALCEFTDGANSGHPVSKEALLLRVPEEVRDELSEDLDFAEALLDLGRWYRERRDRAK